MGARIPVDNQLNVEEWKRLLENYWDQQLLQFLEFGFPVGFNRNCPLYHSIENHKSAVDHPKDVETYLQEEIAHKAIQGPFKQFPIDNIHVSPFMTRNKPNSETRRVIVDLSWPHGTSVNDGVDKNVYMGSQFKLMFPTIDDVTSKLIQLGKGAHIYKIDVSRAFRHLSIDPGDYDLLGLHWNGAYVDTKLPFGCRHGSQFFQRASDAVRYVMRQNGFEVINYIDDFLGVGVPSDARRSFEKLHDVMTSLGLTISAKKLVPPTTQAVCLGILIDTIKGTVAIPEDKLSQVRNMVNEWSMKTSCTKRQLQSLLGSLLYIHKCVKPARCFLNRMLHVLRQAQNPHKILLDADFQRDLLWFKKFLVDYNGVSLFNHRPVQATLELDASLTGLGGCWMNFVYTLPIPLGYKNMGIVQLEMINIVLALKLFANDWKEKKVLIRCDNQAVVMVLQSGRTRMREKRVVLGSNR